jgi:hypothetical protein
MKQHSWNVHEENRNPNSQYFHCYDVVDWEGEERRTTGSSHRDCGAADRL